MGASQARWDKLQKNAKQPTVGVFIDDAMDAIERDNASLKGVLPKVVAADVNQRGNFALRYYDVSRRILRMNKRLHFETGKCLFEKRGHAWALTRFAFGSYDSSDEPLSDVSEVSFEHTSEVLGHEKDGF